MHALTFIASSILCWHLALIAHNRPAAQAFWLTDNTLFQRPPQPPQPLQQQQQQNVADSSKLARPEGRNSSTGGADTSLIASSRVEPWIRLVDSAAATTASSPAGGQQAACQCNADWLQGQASVWLNKWMGSPSFARHLQQSLANLTAGAAGNRRLAWNRASKRHSGGGGGVASNLGAKAAGQQQQQAGDSQQLAAGRPPAVKVVPGERGPKGEPGEPGARGPPGERGPSGASGAISVKDRDALFDLPPAPAGSASEPAGRRLAFVEAEQLLVAETPLGWRPVQMLAPLRDFRKTIAKFSLSSQEQRLRLLGGADEPRQAGGKRARPETNAVLGGLAGETNGDEDEEDEDWDENDEEDDDEDELEGQFEDEEAGRSKGGQDEEAEADEEADEEDEREMNSIRRAPVANLAGGGGGWRAAKGAASSSVEAAGKAAHRPRPNQVSGRSAVAPARAAVETNMVAAAAEAAPDATDGQVARKSAPDGRVDLMKLRLAALNEPFAGNQHGLRGANFECKRHAARSSVKGAFRALLATNYQNLNEIVRHAAHVHGNPVVNLRGETLASSWHDLLRSPARMANPLSRIYSFDGRHVGSDPNWPNKLVWLGASGKFGNREATQNCDGWHSDSLGKFGFATPLHSPRGHLGQSQPQQAAHSARAGGKHHRHQRELAHGAAGNASSAPLVFDAIDKYPCRMPLIVLCIETIAQSGQQD